MINKIIFTTICYFYALILFTPVIAIAEEESGAFTFADPVAYYEHKPITKAQFNIFLAAKFGYSFDEVENEKKAKEIIASYITHTNITNHAKENGLYQNEEFLQKIQEVEYHIAHKLLIEDFLKTLELEEEVLSEYQRYVTEHDLFEYEIHYIMADNVAALEKITAEFYRQKGNFSAVLNRALTDPDENYQGGLLAGWLTPKNMNPHFSQTILNLKQGEISTDPVELNGYFYVFYLNDMREAYISSYQEMHDVLQRKIKGQKIEEYIKSKFGNKKFTINSN